MAQLNRLLMWTFPAGRVFGIPLRIHWSLPLFVVMQLSDTWIELAAPAMAFLFFSILVHELGHCFEARRVGSRVDKIMLWPLGGLAYVSPSANPRADLRVALAGPLTHLPWIAASGLAVFCLRGWVEWQDFNPLNHLLLDPSTYWLALAQLILSWQVILFCFNMFVPAYPLDCGRILVALMAIRGWGRQRVASAIVALSGVAGVLLVVAGQLVLGLWIIIEAAQIHAMARADQLAGHPLFHNIPLYPRAVPPRKPNPLTVVPSGRQCPFCKRNVPPQAKMCGFCEKLIP